jgi:hypothetical protein
MGLQLSMPTGNLSPVFSQYHFSVSNSNLFYPIVAVSSLALIVSSSMEDGTHISITNVSLNCSKKGKSLARKTTSVKPLLNGRTGVTVALIQRM